MLLFVGLTGAKANAVINIPKTLMPKKATATDVEVSMIIFFCFVLFGLRVYFVREIRDVDIETNFPF